MAVSVMTATPNTANPNSTTSRDTTNRLPGDLNSFELQMGLNVVGSQSVLDRLVRQWDRLAAT